MTEMTRRDRTDLMALAKLRTKIAKDAVTARENELLAEVEEQLSAIYDEKDAAWQELADQAAAKVEEFNEQIAKVCDERGIPRRFRPMLMTSWYGRGENGIELRADDRNVWVLILGRSIVHAERDWLEWATERWATATTN